MRDGWRTVRLGQAMSLDVDRVAVEGTESYPLLGVFSFGRGLFERDALVGSKTSYDYLHRLRPGQLVMSKLKAWEGAFAVVPEGYGGRFLSPEFPTYTLDRESVLPDYVRLVVSDRDFWKLAMAKSKGMGGRKQRVNPTALLEIEVALPPLAEQRRIVDLVGAVDTVAAASERVALRGKAMRLAILAAEISTPMRREAWPIVPLGELARLSLGFTKGRRTGDLVRIKYLRAANLFFSELRTDDVAEIEVYTNEVAKHRLNVGDVLLTEGGNPWDVGRGWVWEGQVDPCIHQNSVIRASGFEPGINPRYIAYTLETRELREFFEQHAARTSGVAHLGKGGATFAPIPVPKRAVQDRIVAVLDAVRSIEHGGRHLNEACAQARGAVMSDLLNGRRAIPASYDGLLDGAA